MSLRYWTSHRMSERALSVVWFRLTLCFRNAAPTGTVSIQTTMLEGKRKVYSFCQEQANTGVVAVSSWINPTPNSYSLLPLDPLVLGVSYVLTCALQS